MLYRDLIPGRLGGRYIASHISIPEGGPVADWVHFHRIALQMIYVRRGWVRVVYEDQGEPFVMREGDLVLQPPEIRHRVLESSAGLEVVEISAPRSTRPSPTMRWSLPNGNDPGGSSAASASFIMSRRKRPGPHSAVGRRRRRDVTRDRRLADVRTIRPVDGDQHRLSRRTTASSCSASSSTARLCSNSGCTSLTAPTPS